MIAGRRCAGEVPDVVFVDEKLTNWSERETSPYSGAKPIERSAYERPVKQIEINCNVCQGSECECHVNEKESNCPDFRVRQEDMSTLCDLHFYNRLRPRVQTRGC